MVPITKERFDFIAASHRLSRRRSMTEVNRDVRVGEGDLIAQIDFATTPPSRFGDAHNRLPHAASRADNATRSFVIAGSYLPPL